MISRLKLASSISLVMFAVMLAAVPRVSLAVSQTYATALANCQIQATRDNPAYESHGGVYCKDIGLFQAPDDGQIQEWTGDGLPIYGWDYNMATAPSANGCAAGSTVPNGTPYKQSSATGEACVGTCEMGAEIDSGVMTSILTGNTCPADVPETPTTPKPPASETANADGSKTWCDPISGKCVTGPATAASPPASPSSSANSETDSNTKTNNPASTSSSTSNTTTTGTGTGSGSGDGSGSGTSITQTKTDNPATASSAATKCTTGVCDVGNADGDLGGMYTATTDTPQSVYGDFKNQVSSAPIISSVSGFFSTNGISGTCPTWHIPGNKYWGQAGFDFSFFCSDGMLAILTLAGFMVLAIAAYGAFRIAIY